MLYRAWTMARDSQADQAGKQGRARRGDCRPVLPCPAAYPVPEQDRARRIPARRRASGRCRPPAPVRRCSGPSGRVAIALAQIGLERGVDGRVDRTRRRKLIAAGPFKDLDRAAGDRRAGGQHGVEHRPQAVDVARRPHRFVRACSGLM